MSVSAVSAFDRHVSELMRRTGCDRAKAVQLVTDQTGLTEQDMHTLDKVAAERQLEKAEQWECVRVYRAHNCVVYSTSQARAAKVSPGIPDLLVFVPSAGAFAFHEVKRSVGGVQSPAQAEFQSLCEMSGVRYVLGDRTHAWELLRSLGVVVT